jgi:hypothetical protein
MGPRVQGTGPSQDIGRHEVSIMMPTLYRMGKNKAILVISFLEGFHFQQLNERMAILENHFI